MKILLTVLNDCIAPRFDLATEVSIIEAEDGKIIRGPRTVLLPGPSGDELCGLVLKEDIGTVVCGGIEDAHYQYLTWKKISVLDRVIGPVQDVVQKVLADELQSGTVHYGGPVNKRRNQ